MVGRGCWADAAPGVATARAVDALDATRQSAIALSLWGGIAWSFLHFSARTDSEKNTTLCVQQNDHIKLQSQVHFKFVGQSIKKVEFRGWGIRSLALLSRLFTS